MTIRMEREIGLKHKSQQGFTLLELMIVVAIIAILAAIAYPSYQDSVRQARRAAAQSDLVEMSNFMERSFTEINTYVGPSFASAGITSDFYTYSLTTQTATAFTLDAVPKAGTTQASDSCGTMTLNQTGAKTAAITGCW